MESKSIKLQNSLNSQQSVENRLLDEMGVNDLESRGKPQLNETHLIDDNNMKRYGGFIQTRLRANSQLSNVSSYLPPTIQAIRHLSNNSLTASKKYDFLVNGEPMPTPPPPSSSPRSEALHNPSPPPSPIHKTRKYSIATSLDSKIDLDFISSMNETEENILKIQDIYLTCKNYLDKAEIQLQILKEELKKQANYLKMIRYEPNLFFYNFPQTSYDNLFDKFNNVYRSSLALNNGSRALIILICQMIHKKENIVPQLNHLLYMIRHLFLITSKSEIALNSALEAFQK